MAGYRASLETGRPLDDAFAYMADFANTQEWDPGVVGAERTDAGELGMGSEFAVRFRTGPATSRLVYRVVEWRPPHAVALVGENAALVSHDRIEVAPAPGGSRITYDARLTLKGPLRVADPILQLGFGRAARRALGGLRQVMNG